jgi:glucose uptake protein GlcU
MLDGCSDNCGWTAAVIAVLAWGSFGVPLKTTVKVEMNFFVMQTYKTLVCFATCWLVLLLGVDLRWSNWGIVSGLFWVPGAACGIFGIRNAGLAIAVGTWSSLQVLVSFIFGILIFKEGVKSIYRTFFAFALLTVGLIGMSRYAGASSSNTKVAHHSTEDSGLTFPYKLTPSNSSDLSDSSEAGNTARKSKRQPKRTLADPPTPKAPAVATTITQTNAGSMKPLEMEFSIIDDEAIAMGTALLADELDEHGHPRNRPKDKFHIFIPTFGLGNPVSITLTRHQLGILGAVVNGSWGGCNMIPLHYAMRDHGLSGADYVISFGTGALLVNSIMWIMLFLYHLHQRKGDFAEAVEALPKFQIRELGMPGLMAGVLYSIGNFASILAVAYLGQGTGFSFCQMQLFVSGMWGIFVFHEITGRDIIAKWFFSAMVAVSGIIWLSYEHEGGSIGHR